MASFEDGGIHLAKNIGGRLHLKMVLAYNQQGHRDPSPPHKELNSANNLNQLRSKLLPQRLQGGAQSALISAYETPSREPSHPVPGLDLQDCELRNGCFKPLRL